MTLPIKTNLFILERENERNKTPWEMAVKYLLFGQSTKSYFGLILGTKPRHQAIDKDDMLYCTSY